jgi:putative AdoMet-dependent methyltransferase
MLDKTGFDEWAGEYDSSIEAHLHSFPFIGYYEVLSATVSLVRPERDMKILDVGIGTGLLSQELAKRGCIIYGVDFSSKMLEKARKRISSGHFEEVDVSRGYFGEFSDFQFDRVVSSYFFHHLDLKQKTEFIKKTLRHNLYPHGRIIIADIGFESESDFHAGRIKYEADWDANEFYLCGESIVSHLQYEGIDTAYTQVSCCAGILVCQE